MFFYIFYIAIDNRKRIWVYMGYTMVMIVVLAALATAATVAYQQHSSSTIKRVMEGDTVLLSRLNPSDLSLEITLQEVLQTGDSNHAIDAFLVPCKALKNHFTTINFQSRNLTLTYPTYEFGEQPANTPIYLLAGSNVTYTFRIWAPMYQIKSPEFVIFDNYDSYSTFVAGDHDETNAIFHQQLTVGPNNPVITEVTFHAPEDSYYFITGYAEAGLTYQFNATDNVFFLNETDYMNKYTACHFSVGDSCSFQARSNYFGSSTAMCLIAHINKPPAEDPPSTHIIINTKNNYDALVLFPPFLATISFIIVVLLLIVVTAPTTSAYKRVFGSGSGSVVKE